MSLKEKPQFGLVGAASHEELMEKLNYFIKECSKENKVLSITTGIIEESEDPKIMHYIGKITYIKKEIFTN